MKLLSRVRLFATPWTRAYQAPPSMEFSRQEYWRGLPFPSKSYLTVAWYGRRKCEPLLPFLLLFLHFCLSSFGRYCVQRRTVAKGSQRASSLPLSVTFWARYYVTLAILGLPSHYHQQFLELKKQRITALPAQPRAADCCHEHLFLKKWNSSSHFHPQSCRGRLEILYMFQISKWKGM